MNDESKKRLANYLPDLGDERNLQYDFSSLGLKPYSTDSYLPYFVVYRYKSSSVGSPLFMEAFTSLFALYQFVSNNYERWSFYSVGKCLESYLLND